MPDAPARPSLRPRTIHRERIWAYVDRPTLDRLAELVESRNQPLGHVLEAQVIGLKWLSERHPKIAQEMAAFLLITRK